MSGVPQGIIFEVPPYPRWLYNLICGSPPSQEVKKINAGVEFHLAYNRLSEPCIHARPNTPVMACTATATHNIKADIMLGMCD